MTSSGSVPGERREAAQVEEQDADVSAVTGQQRSAVLARYERRDLRRQEAGKLGALTLDRLEELRVGDGDRALICERRQNIDLGIHERVVLVARGPDDADHVVLDEDRDAQQRPEMNRAPLVVGVGADVGNVHRPLGQHHATSGTRVKTLSRCAGEGQRNFVPNFVPNSRDMRVP
jgi:hypothetical protein